MNTQFFTRVTQIKQYINNLKDSLVAKDHQSASVMVSKFKNIILKQDAQQYAYECILDSLQTKNQKLLNQLNQQKQQKAQFEQALENNKNRNKSIKQTKVQFVLTRLSINLSDSKKLQFKQGHIYSDYTNLYINSGNKYQNYPVAVKTFQTMENKSNMIHVCFGREREERFNLILKFNNQKDAQKWSICLKFAQLIAKNKNQANLFERETKEQDKKKEDSNKITVLMNNNVISGPSGNGSHANPSNQILSLNLKAGLFNYHKNSPEESMISENRSHEKGGQKSHEKDTERSLVNALDYNGSKGLNSRKGSRGDLRIPAGMYKSRGLSDHISNNFDLLPKQNKKRIARKQSENIFMAKPNTRFPNQKFPEKVLTRDRDESFKSQAQQIKKPDTKHQFIEKQLQKSSKLQTLQNKKKELLGQQNHTFDKQDKLSAFAFDTKVNWTGIHIPQLQDEQKSKSSNNRDSIVSSIAHDSNGKIKEYDDRKSQKISERSMEQSPKLPISQNKTGTQYVIRLMQVEKSQEKDQGKPSSSVTFKDDQPNIDILQQTESKVLTQSQSGSDQHSNPSTHENHTESQDNNGRAQELKKGIFVTKCSQNGFWTHEKILYLSENENELCSRDLKDKKIKKIKLSNIQEVQYKAYYKGIIKHVSKIEQDKCLVIQALAEDNKIKNYEYVGNLAEPLQRFATSLKLFVQYYMKQ